jgi:hypothetical protein
MLAARVEPKNDPKENKKTGNFKPVVFDEFQTGVDTLGPDHEAVIRFCGQGSEAAGPFSKRHCSHSRTRIAATSDHHRLTRCSRVPNLFVLSR